MQDIKIKKSHLRIGIIIIIALVFFFAPKFTGNATIETTDMVSAEEIILQTTNGKTITLSQFKDKVVILQAMASWCPSCKLQAQQIKPVYEKYKDKDLIIISLDIQPELSSLEDLKNFKKDFGGDWHFGFYPEFIRQYRVRSLDSTIIVDKKGNTAYRDDTITTTEKLENIIKPLLLE